MSFNSGQFILLEIVITEIQDPRSITGHAVCVRLLTQALDKHIIMSFNSDQFILLEIVITEIKDPAALQDTLYVSGY